MVPATPQADLDDVAPQTGTTGGELAQLGPARHDPASGREARTEDVTDDPEPVLSAHRTWRRGLLRTVLGDPHQFPLGVADLAPGNRSGTNPAQDLPSGEPVVDAARRTTGARRGVRLAERHLVTLPLTGIAATGIVPSARWPRGPRPPGVQRRQCWQWPRPQSDGTLLPGT